MAWLDGNPTKGPDAWFLGQLSRFLREPQIAGLLGQVGTEHPKGPSSSRGGGGLGVVLNSHCSESHEHLVWSSLERRFLLYSHSLLVSVRPGTELLL